MSDKRLPTGRVNRLTRVGAAAASQAVKRTGTRAANVGRSDEQAERAMERRQLEAAKQIVTVLGGMKGAAMKVGQVLSFMDVGLVPDEYREEFQTELAKLRDAAPTVSFEQMRKVIETDLGEPLSAVFSEFDDEAIAAASIGQVYRARLAVDGRDVAVKVQYPGINDAVRADLKNLGLILRVARRLTPKLDIDAVGREIRERISEELDYELEAANHRTMARIYRDHPFIVVPDVVTALSRERVIVTEFAAGEGFEQLRAEPEEVRDRVGEIIFRFYYGSMFRHQRFSGDPHPGNMILLPDRRVAFLDFGMFKAVAPEITERELACQRAVIEEDPERLHRLLTEYGFIPEPEKLKPAVLWEFVVEGIWWYTRDQSVRLNQEIASTVAIETADPRSKHFKAMRHQDIVPEHLFGRRLELLTLALLGRLEAEANWYRIAREWIYGDQPLTELGREEAAFYSGR
jgi:predicted unusual protein kinase regulating ubiquinone biosynthesis (AarF/ABC1/UbiB family)